MDKIYSIYLKKTHKKIWIDVDKELSINDRVLYLKNAMSFLGFESGTSRIVNHVLPNEIKDIFNWM
jgi:hypothetical protein